MIENYSYRKLAVALLLTTSLSASAQETKTSSTVDSNFVFSHYTERSAYFKALPKTMKRPVVFLGNSITEAGRWNDILPGQSIVNRGISGDISYGILARLDEVISLKPRKVFLLIGVNDLKREIPAKLIIENYRKIVERLRKESPRTKIYLQSVLPVNPEVLVESFKNVSNSDISILNEELLEIAKRGKASYVNLHEVYSDEKGFLRKEHTPDGIHLHLAAYPLWVNYLKYKKYL